jgi:hypothetical protein
MRDLLYVASQWIEAEKYQPLAFSLAAQAERRL